MTATQSTSPERFDTRQAAEYVGLSPSTLRKDRCTRNLGIPFHKAGSKAVYSREDLDHWLRSRRVE